MEASRKIWEKGLDLSPRDGFRLWGEGARPHLATDLALRSALQVTILRLSIFCLTTWACFGNEAADELFQTSIDAAPRMRAFL
jgi:hypothetical protein